MTRLETHLAHLQRFGIRPGLERAQEILERLGNPQNQYPVVLVGGTNGKGSTCEFLARRLAQSAQRQDTEQQNAEALKNGDAHNERRVERRVGLFTSPHLYRWNERIRVLEKSLLEKSLLDRGISGDRVLETRDFTPHEAFAGAISDDEFDALFDVLQPILDDIARDETLGNSTEFETLTCLGLQYFARRNVDVAVVEVGLGGRHDATNVTNPQVSVVTHVALDHCDRLGNTHAEIAADKICIARPNRVLVTAETRDDVLQVFRAHCDQIGALLWCFQRIEYSNDRQNLENALQKLETQNTVNPKMADVESANKLQIAAATNSANSDFASAKSAATRATNAEQSVENTPPDFQILNAKTAHLAHLALAQSDARFEISTPEFSIANAAKFRTPTVPGRFQIVCNNPLVVLDGANNPDGAAQLAAQLHRVLDARRNVARDAKLTLVLGILRDKDFRAMIAQLAPLAARIIATQSNSPRACSATEIAGEARRFCADVVEEISPQSAFERAVKSSTRNDVVCVTGSFYTLGEIQIAPENLGLETL